MGTTFRRGTTRRARARARARGHLDEQAHELAEHVARAAETLARGVLAGRLGEVPRDEHEELVEVDVAAAVDVDLGEELRDRRARDGPAEQVVHRRVHLRLVERAVAVRVALVEPRARVVDLQRAELRARVRGELFDTHLGRA